MLRLRNDQYVTARFTFLDMKGSQTVAEDVRLESSDEDIVRVAKNSDGSFTLIAEQVGVAQLLFSADALIGEGERIITGSEIIEVVPGEAAVMKLTFSEPQLIGPDAPTGPTGEAGATGPVANASTSQN